MCIHVIAPRILMQHIFIALRTLMWHINFIALRILMQHIFIALRILMQYINFIALRILMQHTSFIALKIWCNTSSLHCRSWCLDARTTPAINKWALLTLKYTSFQFSNARDYAYSVWEGLGIKTITQDQEEAQFMGSLFFTNPKLDLYAILTS